MSYDNNINRNNEKGVIKSTSENINKIEKYNPGEKGFSIFIFAFGLFFFYQSVLMYQKKPGASSYAAVPLFVSSLIIVFSILIFIFDFKKDSANRGLPISIRIKNTLSYAFQKDVLVIMLFILFYCAALIMKIGFYIITPFFLWASMSYLMRKNYLHNILWTILSLVFIYLMFSFAFNVVMP